MILTSQQYVTTTMTATTHVLPFNGHFTGKPGQASSLLGSPPLPVPKRNLWKQHSNTLGSLKMAESLTDLDASLPLEVDAPQFGVVVNGGDV